MLFMRRHLLPNLLILSLAVIASGCATATRGSQTYFVVETLPTDAKVFTDKLNTSSPEQEFYGCEATPCKISMSRRSQFNIMITKDGYAPFFYVVQKRPHKELKLDKAKREAFHLNANGEILSTDELSQNAGGMPVGKDTSISAATGTAIGAWYTGEIISAIAVGGTITAPVAAILAGPALMTGYGVDLTSGALIDLTPNPMVVKLTDETDKAESKRLQSAFLKSRSKK